MHTSEYLRSDDISHLVKHRVADRNIPKYYGTLEDTDDGWKGFHDRLMHTPESLLVGHIATKWIGQQSGAETVGERLYVGDVLKIFFNSNTVAFVILDPSRIDLGIPTSKNQILNASIDHPVTQRDA